MTEPLKPHHGGKLRQASEKHQIPLNDWLDLSTGVSPYCYPIPAIPNSVWNRLPEDEDGLQAAAASYYQHSNLLPVAGSQAAIQVLPQVLSQSLSIGTVLLPSVGYKEHQHAWQTYQRNSHQPVTIRFYQNQPSEAQLKSADVVVVINPNNPSATLHPAETLFGWRKQMSSEAVLIVDEAFIDATQQESLLPHLPTPIPTNTIVLRSVGKFFGLAGARVGFCFTHPQHLKKMSQKLGPWTLSGPSRYVVQHALNNREWQVQTRETLHLSSQRLHDLLSRYFEHVCPQILFQRVELSNATKCHQTLAKQGVFTRLCDEKDAIRFGLPHQEADWKKLETTLNQIKDTL